MGRTSKRSTDTDTKGESGRQRAKGSKMQRKEADQTVPVHPDHAESVPPSTTTCNLKSVRVVAKRMCNNKSASTVTKTTSAGKQFAPPFSKKATEECSKLLEHAAALGPLQGTIEREADGSTPIAETEVAASFDAKVKRETNDGLSVAHDSYEERSSESEDVTATPRITELAAGIVGDTLVVGVCVDAAEINALSQSDVHERGEAMLAAVEASVSPPLSSAGRGGEESADAVEGNGDGNADHSNACTKPVGETADVQDVSSSPGHVSSSTEPDTGPRVEACSELAAVPADPAEERSSPRTVSLIPETHQSSDASAANCSSSSAEEVVSASSHGTGTLGGSAALHTPCDSRIATVTVARGSRTEAVSTSPSPASPRRSPESHVTELDVDSDHTCCPMQMAVNEPAVETVTMKPGCDIVTTYDARSLQNATSAGQCDHEPTAGSDGRVDISSVHRHPATDTLPQLQARSRLNETSQVVPANQSTATDQGTDVASDTCATALPAVHVYVHTPDTLAPGTIAAMSSSECSFGDMQTEEVACPVGDISTATASAGINDAFNPIHEAGLSGSKAVAASMCSATAINSSPAATQTPFSKPHRKILPVQSQSMAVDSSSEDPLTPPSDVSASPPVTKLVNSKISLDKDALMDGLSEETCVCAAVQELDEAVQALRSLPVEHGSSSSVTTLLGHVTSEVTELNHMIMSAYRRLEAIKRRHVSKARAVAGNRRTRQFVPYQRGNVRTNLAQNH